MSSDPWSKYESTGYKYTTMHNDTYAYIDATKADLSGRYVLITGASKGIGRACAVSYAQAGVAGLALGARSDLGATKDAVEKAAADSGKKPPKLLLLKMDVTDRASMEAAVEPVKSQFGHLDIILLNAGVLEPNVPLLKSDPDTWWQTYETNMLGPYLTLRSFLPLVISSPNPDKTVIGFSSFAAHLVAPGYSAYQPGKLAIIRLMEFVMAEYGPEGSEGGGVLAYAIHPRSILTEMGKTLPKSSMKVMTDTVELCGDTCVWLTKERREWLGGRYISVAWDMEELEGKRAEIEERDLLKVRMAMGGDR